jgi:hypothetical protein
MFLMQTHTHTHTEKDASPELWIYIGRRDKRRIREGLITCQYPVLSSRGWVVQFGDSYHVRIIRNDSPTASSKLILRGLAEPCHENLDWHCSGHAIQSKSIASQLIIIDALQLLHDLLATCRILFAKAIQIWSGRLEMMICASCGLDAFCW